MGDMNIQRDARVEAADGELGRVKHVIVDPQTKEVTDLVVARDGGETIIPMSAVSRVEGDRVLLGGSGSQYRSGGRFDMSQYHAVDADEVRSETERTALRGGAPLVNADKNEVEVAGRQQATAGTQRPVDTGRMQTGGDQPYRLRLREEHLKVSKQREQAGEVEIGKRVVERTESIDVPVTEERVIIERTAGNGQTPVRGEIGKDEQVIDVPVMKERVNVEKEAVVTEEVNVRKEAVQHTEHVQGTVRKEELDVQGDRNLVAGGRDGRSDVAADEVARHAELRRSRP